LTFAEDLYYLKAGDVDVDEAKPGQSAAEGRLLPELLEEGSKRLKIIKIPVFSPGKNDQKETHFKGENGQRNLEQPPLPTHPGTRNFSG
jgi:hypothetical protein